MTNEEKSLRRFGSHCRAFYDSSLILYPSTSSLASMQEEKKTEGAPPNELKRRGADGKIALEALDRIGAIRSISESLETRRPDEQKVISGLQNSIGNLRKEHASIAKSNVGILTECGLLDIDQFLAKSSSQEEDMLEKYIQIRDAMRRRAHKISMLHRQHSFFDLLSESAATVEESSHSTPRLTQVDNMRQTIATIQQFVKKYQSNIGAHPFLAGLHRMVDLQLNPKPGSKQNSKDPAYVVRWKFRGSVLTEACRSCHHENDDDELAYAREAVQTLFSFLIWIKDVDVEGGGSTVPIDEDDYLGLDQILDGCSRHSSSEESAEPVLSFEVDKHLSNANLRRILSVLPDPKRLDARATGSMEVVCTSESEAGLVPRKNVDGGVDEQWPWFARFELCTLL